MTTPRFQHLFPILPSLLRVLRAPRASVRILSSIALLLILPPILGAQTNEQSFSRRIVWRGGEHALRYAVEIDRSQNGLYRNHLREFTTAMSIVVSLPPGDYRFRIIPHDILDRPVEGTQWMHFEIRPPLIAEIFDLSAETEQIEVIDIDDFSSAASEPALLLDTSTASASLPSQQESLLAPQGGNNYRGNFSTSQRVGTYFLNILPGVGSYAIMNDIMGGTILLLSGVTGWALFTTGIYILIDTTYTTSTTRSSYESGTESSSTSWTETKIDDEDKADRGLALMLAGGVILLGNGIFNIARSASYNKPQQPNRTSLLSPEAWQIAILPGKGGIEKAALSYTLRY